MPLLIIVVMYHLSHSARTLTLLVLYKNKTILFMPVFSNLPVKIHIFTYAQNYFGAKMTALFVLGFDQS